MRQQGFIVQNKPQVLIALLLTVVLICALQIFFPATRQMHEIALLRSTNSWMHKVLVSEWWSVLGALSLILLNMLLIYRLNDRFNIVPDANYFPLWLYLIIVLSDYRLMHLSENLIASTLMLISISFLFLTPHLRKDYPKLFWSGWFFAIGTVFSPQMIVYLPVFFIGLVVFNHWRLRTVANFLLAMLSVYFLLFGFHYLFNGFDEMQQYFMLKPMFQGILEPEFIPLILDSLLTVLILISISFFISKAGFLKVVTRKYLWIIVCFVFVSGVAYMFDGFNVYIRFFLAIPISFLVSNYLINRKHRILFISFTSLIFILFIFSLTLSVLNSLS